VEAWDLEVDEDKGADPEQNRGSLYLLPGR